MRNTPRYFRLLLLFILVAVAVLNHVLNIPKLASFAGYAGLLPFLFLRHKPWNFVGVLLPIILAFVAGILLSWQNAPSDIFRDVFYYLNPVVFLVIGAMYAYHFRLTSFVKLLVLTGSFLSLAFVVIALYYLGFDALTNQKMVRAWVGVGNPVSVFALLLLIFAKRFTLLENQWPPILRYLMIFVNLAGLVFFGSRTYYGTFVIGMIVMLYPFYKKNLVKYLVIFAVLVVIVGIVLSSVQNSFVVDKLFNSFTEMAVSEELNLNEEELNFRGFETFMAIQTYIKGNPLELIVGSGLGKLIDLGMDVELGGKDWRFIPVLHNGYAYILVKTGLLGIFLFGLFLVRIVKMAGKVYEQHKMLFCLTLTALYSVYFATSIVGGFFNMEFVMGLMVLGAMIYYVYEELNQQDGNQEELSV